MSLLWYGDSFFCVVFCQAPISSFNLNEKTFVNIKLRLEANQVWPIVTSYMMTQDDPRWPSNTY